MNELGHVKLDDKKVVERMKTLEKFIEQDKERIKNKFE